MANTFKLKTSSVSGKIPTTSDLQSSELAYNSFDGKLYAKRNNGTESIIEIGASAGGATNLDGLSDVAITSAAKGQFIVHDGTQFVNSRTIESNAAATVPLTIKGAASQSGNYFHIKDSGNNNVLFIDSTKQAVFYGTGNFAGGSGSTSPCVLIQGPLESGFTTSWPTITAGIQTTSGVQYPRMMFTGNNGSYIDFVTANNNANWYGRIWATSSYLAIGTSSGGSRGYCATFGGWSASYPSLVLSTLNAGAKGLIVQGIASQTANLLELQNSSGTAYTSVGANGNVNLTVASGTDIPFTITGASNHTNYMFVAKNSSNAHLVSIIGNGSTFMSVDSASVSNLTITRPASHTKYGLLIRNSSGKRIFGVGADASLAGEPSGWGSTVELGNDDYQMVRIGYHSSTGALRVLTTTDTLQSWESPGGAAGIYYLTLARNTTTTSWNFSLAGFATSVRFETTLHANRFVEKSANAFDTALSPASGTLTVDTSNGNAVLGALSASVTTWAFTNVPTDNSKVTKVTAVIAGNTSYTYGDACSVNGTAITGGVQWSGGSAPASTSGTDIVTFIIVRDSAGTIKVFGDAVTNFS